MINLAPSAADMLRVSDVALGRAPADLVIVGGRVVDVHSEAILDGWSVAIAAGRIAGVAAHPRSWIGPQTEVVDASDQIVAPGLIEPHTHLGRLFIRETARLQLAAGVTTSVVETTEVGYIGGVEAVRVMLREARRAPGRVLLTLSPMIGLDAEHDSELGTPEVWLPLLEDDRVVGVGEAYWADLLRGHERSRALYAEAVARGIPIEGHGAGAKSGPLAAMAAVGVGSDHEPTTPEEVWARLRLGMYVYLRHGVTRQDLSAFAPLWQDRRPPERVAFCTDGVSPRQLLASRTLNAVVGEAVKSGLPLPTAIRMASLVPAQRFGLAPWLGSLVTGAHADLAIYPDESLIGPSLVLFSGAPPHAAGPADLSALRWRPPSFAFDESVFARPAGGRFRAMAILREAPMVSREVETDGSDALPFVAIDRIHGRRSFRGLVVGLGLAGGAMASTAASESVALCATGDSASDMRLACERVTQMGGGVAVISGGREVARWEAPVAGLLSDAAADAVAEDVDRVNDALRRLGCRLPDPLTTIDFLTSPAIPHLRVSPDGYHRIRDGSRLPLEIDS